MMYTRYSHTKLCTNTPPMLSRKKLILFDVDDTLAKSKCPMSDEMASTIGQLLRHVHVGIISGGKWEVLKKNIVDRLPENSADVLHKFHVLPTSGARYHAYHDEEWKEVYANLIEKSESARIMQILLTAIEGEYERPEVYGDIVEDRGTMVSLALFGQTAPISVKENADRDHSIRKRIVAKAAPCLSEYEVRIGGATSIDVSKKGMDKGYGVKAIAQHLGLSLDEIGFVGDAVFPGGNDYPVKELGVEVLVVKNEDETLRHLISWLEQEKV